MPVGGILLRDAKEEESEIVGKLKNLFKAMHRKESKGDLLVSHDS